MYCNPAVNKVKINELFKRNTRILGLSVCNKCSICDLICDATHHAAFDMGEICVCLYDNIITDNLNKRYKIWKYNEISTRIYRQKAQGVWVKFTAYEGEIMRIPRKRHIVSPSLLPDVTRVKALKILGVIISYSLSVSDYVSNVISSSAQAVRVLRLFRAHMACMIRLLVYQAVIVAKLTYAASDWWGFANASDRSRL